MIETFKSKIIELLQAAGEPVANEDEMVFTRLGEGRGYTSCLWSVTIGGGKYAVKISDASGQSALQGMPTAFYVQQHNRELQVYEWMEKFRAVEETAAYAEYVKKTVRTFGGTKCEVDKPGILIMADASEHSTSYVNTSDGIPLNTILSIIDGVVDIQSAYFIQEEALELVPKDLHFELASSWITGLIETTAEQSWFKPEWEDVLTAWTTVESIRAIQYMKDEGDLPFGLAHSDMWTNNILFAKSKQSDELELLAFVDWQEVIIGNPLTDIASVLAINMSTEDRRKHERVALQHYIDGIKSRSDRFKKEFPVDSVEKLLPQYRRSLRFAALQLLMTLQDEIAPEEEEGEVKNEKTKKNREEPGIYTQRFIGLLEDIID